MKIICIGRNYREHAVELGNQVPDEPVFFLKPDSSILKSGNAFFIPDFSNEIHYELELLVKINRLGKNIDKEFAHRYYNEVGLGIDFTARDIQAKCKTRGLPWEKAKAFDSSALIGDFVDVATFGALGNLDLRLEKNGEIVQEGTTKDMIFSIDELIAYVSRFMTLKIGDILFTGTPAGVGRVDMGDKLEGFLNGSLMLKCPIR